MIVNPLTHVAGVAAAGQLPKAPDRVIALASPLLDPFCHFRFDGLPQQLLCALADDLGEDVAAGRSGTIRVSS